MEGDWKYYFNHKIRVINNFSILSLIKLDFDTKETICRADPRVVDIQKSKIRVLNSKLFDNFLVLSHLK